MDLWLSEIVYDAAWFLFTLCHNAWPSRGDSVSLVPYGQPQFRRYRFPNYIYQSGHNIVFRSPDAVFDRPFVLFHGYTAVHKPVRPKKYEEDNPVVPGSATNPCPHNNIF